MTKLSALLVALLTLSSVIAQSAPVEATVPLALLERAVGEDAQAYVGRLPADLPLPLALPDDFTVDLSVTRSWPGSTYHQLFLTAPSPPLAATEALARSLEAAGLSPFTPPEDAWGWWGFTDTPAPPVPGALFCGEKASVEVGATSAGGTTQLTLSVGERSYQPNAYGVCDEEAYGYGPSQEQPDLLPPPLEGATLLGTESGSLFSVITEKCCLQGGPAPATFPRPLRRAARGGRLGPHGGR